MALYADPDSAHLQTLESESTLRRRAVATATARIDACLVSAPEPYTVPVDTSTITDSEEKEKADGLLAWLAESIAAYELTKGHTGTSQKISKDYEEVEKWLERICGGEMVLPVPIERSTTAKNFAVQGDRARDFPDTLLDCHEQLLVDS